MKLKISLLILFASGITISSLNLFAQHPGINYRETYAGAAYVPLVGGTIIHSPGTDDAVVGPIPIGFKFTYGGQPVTNIWVSSNGWLSFAAPPSSMPANNLATTATVPLLAPLWDNLKVASTSGASVTYGNLSGSSFPNTILIIQWDSMLWNNTEDTASMSFQVKLHEDSTGSGAPNQIDFQYRRLYGTTNITGASASIGIAGFCPGDFYSMQNSGVGNVNTGVNAITKNADYGIFSNKPNNPIIKFFPQVQSNDNCSSPDTLIFNPATTLISKLGTTVQSTKSFPALNCWAADSGANINDVWFTFVKPAGISNFELFTDSAGCNGSGVSIEVYTGSCPIGPGTALYCDRNSNGGTATNNSYLNLINQPCAATTYYVRVEQDGDSMQTRLFRLNIRPPGRDCAFATNICSIPYSSPTGLTTCGFTNDYDSTNSSCHTPRQNGEDYVFSYTPVSTGCVNVSLNNTPANSYPGLLIYQDCPDIGSCLANVTGLGVTPITFNNLPLVAGLTYYFVVDYDDNDGFISCMNNFDLTITTSATPSPTYDNCATPIGPISVSSSNCIGAVDYFTNCTSPSNMGSVPLPGCGNFTDGVTTDVWATFTSANTTPHQINVDMGTAPSAQDLAMAVYTSSGGSCGPFTLINCDDNSNGIMPSLTVVPPAANTIYYVRIWSNNGTQPGNFRICVVNSCGPSNDLPCSAVMLTNGQPILGDNGCSTGLNEPASPACWGSAGSALNTVWYSFVATSTTMKVRTRLFSLYDSQIAIYSGPCGPAMTALFCNDDYSIFCGWNATYQNSDIIATGLTVNQTYYVRVDGWASYTGTFEITVIDGTSIYPPVPSQDCALPISVCSNSTFTVPDPGYTGIGNICDVGGTGTCMIAGERSSSWYTFAITGPATLQWLLTTLVTDDYDWMMWCVDTIWNNNPNHVSLTVPNYCNSLTNPSLFPWTTCNVSHIDNTGMSTLMGTDTVGGVLNQHRNVGPGSTPPLSQAAFIPAGMTATFVLSLNNWSLTTTGYTMNWLGTAINANPPFLTWQDATSQTWDGGNNASAWFPSCGIIPNCTNNVPAFISSGGIQPVVTSSTSVKDLTINAGATLTINPGVTLTVCGNFTNNGILKCAATSTIKFTGSNNSSISGTFAPTGNTFANVIFAKDNNNAIVTLNTNLYIQGTDSIKSGIVNSNSRNTEVGRNFYNHNGSISYTGLGSGVGGSTLTFTYRDSFPAEQLFRNDSSVLVLNNVTMNQVAASSARLKGGTNSNMILGTSGVLSIIQGKIITDTLKVDVTNSALAACNSGNTTSYVEGNLRRAIWLTTGIYEFPVGEATKGYQRFSLDYTTASSVAYTILGRFRTWSAMPAAGPNVTECVSANYSCCAPYNNGYWTMDPSLYSNIGTYTANAYPLSVTNDIGGAPNGYSIMKSVSNNGGGPWLMMGNCVTPSTSVSPVSRAGLTTFSDFGVVQYTSPLPIQLLSFNAEQREDGINCSWVTESEINNDHFELERRQDNTNFEMIANINGFGAGTSTQTLSYSYLDEETCDGIIYYRLRQVDIDGKFTYSNVVAVNCDENKNGVNLFPNPANTLVNIGLFQQHKGKVRIRFIDVVGQVVKDEEKNIENGYNYFSIGIDDLPVGVYYVSIKNDEREIVSQVKFLKY